MTRIISVNSRQARRPTKLTTDGNPLDSVSQSDGVRHTDGIALTSATKEAFTIVLEPLPNWRTSPVQRLKRALKYLLRTAGLRAISVRQGCQCDICQEQQTKGK